MDEIADKQLVISTKKRSPPPTDGDYQVTKKSKKAGKEVEDIVEHKKKSKKPPKMQTKCRPQQLVKLINNLNEEQRQAVKDIGFGGLLELKLTQIPHGIMDLLLKAFNCTSTMFNTRKLDFLLTKDDVHDVFQLPRVGSTVELATTGSSTTLTDHMLKNELRLEFGQQSGNIPVKQVHERLMACDNADDNFKRLFVLYSMSIFLAPTSNKTLDFRLLRAVENVSDIKNYDWCAYVFHEMITSIDLYKKGKRANLTGCILVLMVAYFHRFDFKGVAKPHTLPLIKHWDDTEFSKRVDDEKNAKSLGSAPISKIEYPICKQREEPNLPLTQTSDHDAEPEMEAPEIEAPEGYMLIKLPKGVETDKQIREKGLDRGREIFERMKRDNELFFSRCVTNTRELINIKRSTIPKNNTDRQACADGKDDGRHTGEARAPVLSQTPPIFRDETFHMFMDSAIARAHEKKLEKQGLPAFDVWTEMMKMQYKELNRVYGGCTDKELLSDDDMDCNKEKEDEGKYEVTYLNSEGDGMEPDLEANLDDLVTKIGTGLTAEVTVEVTGDAKEKLVSGDGNEEVNGGRKENEVTAGPNLDVLLTEKRVTDGTKENVVVTINDYLLHAEDFQKKSMIPPSANMIPPNLGCSLDCGLPDNDSQLLSLTMLTNQNYYRNVLKLRRDVMDYCFLDDYTIDKTQVVCKFGIFHAIPKEDIESLLPERMIEAVVVESWAILLNELLREQNGSNNLKRIFYGIAHSHAIEELWNTEGNDEVALDRLRKEIYTTWDTWSSVQKEPLNLDTDLVFIPLLHGDHYVCVCVDFRREQMFYLDNRKYDTYDDVEHVKLAQLAGSVYGGYIRSKGIEKGRKALDYIMTNVEFDWQTNEENLDCGVFMMFHMLFFVGDNFRCQLYSGKYRDIFRGEIAATLVLSDLNESRSEILEEVSQLTERKATLITKLTEQRGKKQKKKKVHTPLSKIKASVEDGSTSVVGSKKRGESDGIGCTYDCGGVDEKLEVVSTFMKANKSQFSRILTLRKEVIDYCLFQDDDFPLDEVVATFSHHKNLDRGDILSILPNAHLRNNVIECWALILNHIEHMEKCDTSLLFFGIGHMETIPEGAQYQERNITDVHKVWKEFLAKNTVPCNLSADLIFIPMIWRQHYFCVCINFKTSKIEVLDNTKYENWEDTEIYKMADCVAQDMSDFLEARKIERVEEIMGFEVSIVNFDWQKKELNNTESGNFLMMHMIRYEGKVFDADLTSKLYRRYYWAQIAAAVLLADINENRPALLEKVVKFAAWKQKVGKNMGKGKAANKEASKEEKERDAEDKKINTELPILRQNPRRGHNADEEAETNTSKPLATYIRIKGVAAKPRGRGRGSH